jgi:hypothetical protein
MAIDYRILQPWSYETPNQLAQQSASLRQMATSDAMNQQAMAQGRQNFANQQQLFGQGQQEYAAKQQAAQVDAQENEQLKQLFPNYVNPETKEIDIDGFYMEAAKINPKKAEQFRKEYAEYQDMLKQQQFKQKDLEIKEAGLGSEKMNAETNARNAETQAKNLKLQQDKFNYEKTKPNKTTLEGIDPDTGKPYTQGQRTAANYALRISEAESNLDRLSSAGFNPSDVRSIILNPKKLNAVKSPELRQYAQAMRTFINAVLRRESGAAISPTEFDSANSQYFASLNDDPATLSQKRNTRLQVLGALKAEAGSAFGDAMNEYQKLSGGVEQPTVPIKTVKEKKALNKEFDDLWGVP